MSRPTPLATTYPPISHSAELFSTDLRPRASPDVGSLFTASPSPDEAFYSAEQPFFLHRRDELREQIDSRSLDGPRWTEST